MLKTKISESFCLSDWIVAGRDRVKGKAPAEHIREGSRQMSLGADSFGDIWNSQYIKNVRRQMVHNQPVAAQLWLGNNCNLKPDVRSAFTFRIAADEIQKSLEPNQRISELHNRFVSFQSEGHEVTTA